MKVTFKMIDPPLAWTHPDRALGDVRAEFFAQTKELTERSAEIVRTRVSTYGVGADSISVKGYSRMPIQVSQYSGLKPKRRPRGAESTRKLDNRNNWVGFYRGGYAEYREKIGLRTDGFFFSNFGTAWRHWGDVGPRIFLRSRAGFIFRANIGFRRAEDQIASARAAETRSYLFQIGPMEAAILFKSVFLPTFNNAFRRHYSVQGSGPGLERVPLRGRGART